MSDTREPAPARPRAKRVLVVIAGAFDPPGAATPLADAEKPALDAMAREGRAGTAVLGALSPWDGFTSLLGLGGAAPSLGAAEALGAGVEVSPGEVAYRADFVTLGDRGVADPFGGKVKDPEAALLVDEICAAAPRARLVRLGGHRNLAVLPGPAQFCPSPWEMVGQKPHAALPAEGPVREFWQAASATLAAHDVNQVRIDLRENPANGIWLHGGGPVPAAAASPTAPEGGAVLVGRGAATAGLARVLGWEASLVEGDDEVLAAAALAAMARADLVVVRTESVLDAAALGGPDAKRDALSRADARLVAPLLAAAEERDSFVMAVAADCVFDSATRALVRRPVPLVVCGAGRGGTGHAAAGGAFTEQNCETSGWRAGSGADVAALLGATGPSQHAAP